MRCVLLFFLAWENKVLRFWETAYGCLCQNMDLSLRQFQSLSTINVPGLFCTDLGEGCSRKFIFDFVIGLRRLCHLLFLWGGQFSKMSVWLHILWQRWREMVLIPGHWNSVLVQLWFWLKNWIFFSPQIEGVNIKECLLSLYGTSF